MQKIAFYFQTQRRMVSKSELICCFYFRSRAERFIGINIHKFVKQICETNRQLKQMWWFTNLINLTIFFFCSSSHSSLSAQLRTTRKFKLEGLILFEICSLCSLVVMHLVHLQRVLCSLFICARASVYSGCRKNLIKVQVLAHCSSMTYVHV